MGEGEFEHEAVDPEGTSTDEAQDEWPSLAHVPEMISNTMQRLWEIIKEAPDEAFDNMEMPQKPWRP